MLVPKGFAHAYCTLNDDREALYKVTNYYQPQAEGALRWNDPALGIDWKLPAVEITVNARDAAARLLTDLATPFVY